MPLKILIPFIEEIQEVVIEVSGFSWDEILEKSAQREKVRARNFFCLLVSNYYPKMKDREIADIIQRTDHTCIVRAKKTILNDLEHKHEPTIQWHNKIINLIEELN